MHTPIDALLQGPPLRGAACLLRLLLLALVGGDMVAQEEPSAPVPVQEPAPVQEPVPESDPEPDPEEEFMLDDLEGLDDFAGLDDGAVMDGADAAATSGIRVTGFEGFFESRGKFFYRDRRSDGGLKDGQWIQELQLEFDLSFGERLTGYFRPRFLIDVIDEDLHRTDPLEAYLTWSGDSFDLRAGMLVENWGIADTFNPIDVLNRRDLATDPLDPQRLGELGARLRFWGAGGDTIAEPMLSAYVIPVFQEAAFPTVSNRFSLVQAPGSQLREDLSVTPRGEERVFAALRAQAVVSTDLANADVQFVVSRGPERFPIFDPAASTGGGVDLIPVYFGQWNFGGGFRAVPNAAGWSDYTIKSEIVYKVPYRVAGSQPAVLPDEYLQYAFGFDRVFPNVFSDRDQLTATLEWVGETGAEDSTAAFRPFDDDLVVRAFWEANDFDRSTVELRGFVDPAKGEWILEGIYQQQLRSIDEDLQVELGLQVIDAARSEVGFFSLFPNNSNLQLAFRLDF